jgi:hypothetical protein
MAAVLASPETGLEFAAVHGTVILHVAEGSAAELLGQRCAVQWFCRFLFSVRRGCAPQLESQ